MHPLPKFLGLTSNYKRGASEWTVKIQTDPPSSCLYLHPPWSSVGAPSFHHDVPPIFLFLLNYHQPLPVLHDFTDCCCRHTAIRLFLFTYVRLLHFSFCHLSLLCHNLLLPNCKTRVNPYYHSLEALIQVFLVPLPVLTFSSKDFYIPPHCHQM